MEEKKRKTETKVKIKKNLKQEKEQLEVVDKGK